MAIATSFPTYAYAAGQAPQIVQSQAALNALGSAWFLTPFPNPPTGVPFDTGFPDTDTRLQQMLVEQRVTNQLLQIGLNIADDPQLQIRPDVLLNDSSLSS